jgi:diguanylate cyclase (GGDEF)-like protein
MISIKQFLDQTQTGAAVQTPAEAIGESVGSDAEIKPEIKALLPVTLAAYRSALVEMANCGQDVCPALGQELKQELSRLATRLVAEPDCGVIEKTEIGVREQLHKWGQGTAKHYREKAREVKEILLVMANTAESVGERDNRCAAQFSEVTTRLRGIANLEDLTEIRESIKKSATELKSSIERMTAEGKAAMDHLRAEVSTYQARLEAAEEVASRDALTGVHSRSWVESQIEKALDSRAPFCVAIIDLNEFKKVNDEHGHLVGDELLKKFSAKLKSVCRSTDTIGRWGGDEFMLLLHSGIKEAHEQIDRMREWVCGNYTVRGTSAPIRLCVAASIGLTERQPEESIKELVDRADAEMYREKAASRSGKNSPVQ